MHRYIRTCLDLIFPRLCPICGRPLLEGEKYFCASCAYSLPHTHFDSLTDNPACDRMAGKIPFDSATAFLQYGKESSVQTLFELFKYHGNKDLAYQLGMMAADYFLPKGLFDRVDCILPLPLHENKWMKRGYNQSEWIARGLSSVSGLNVDTDAVFRKVENPTQTRKGIWDRKLNVENIFALRFPENLGGRRVLIVDDVMTTGATMEACARCVWSASPSSVSFFALALA